MLERGRQSFPTSAGGPARSETVEGWRTILYLQLMASRPGFDPQEAARLAVSLSQDVAFTNYVPAELAIAACRLLDPRGRQIVVPESEGGISAA